MDILVLEGDDIGPEITAATLRVLDAVSKAFALDLSFERLPVGLALSQKPARRFLRAR